MTVLIIEVITLVLIFLACGRLVNWVVPAVRKRIVSRFQDATSQDIEPRARTLGLAVRKGGVIAIRILTGIGLLKVLGVDTAPISAAIGVFGVALGFGARAMVQDLLAGLWILVEDRFRMGDKVAINGVAGTVIDMTFRTIILRDAEGNRHLFQNGQISALTINNKYGR